MAFLDDRRRKKQQRVRVSDLEKRIGYVILVLIAGVAVAIYAKGRRFDPDLFALDVTALEAGAPVVAPTVELRTPELSSPLDESSGDAPFQPPNGWRVMGAVERFDPENLYVKINGRAEQFLSYGFVELVAATLLSDAHPDAFIDVFIYNMGTSLNAFGVFAAERSSGEPADHGEKAYASEGSLFFRTGTYYVQIIASDGSEALSAVVDATAAAVDAAHSGETTQPWAFDVFPPDRLVLGSLGYVRENAMGLSFLNDVHTARYAAEAGEASCFLTRAESPEVAQQLFDRYRDYVAKYGTVVEETEGDSGPRFTGDIGGIFDSVFRSGSALGGATSAPDAGTADDLARALQDAL